MPLSGYIVVIKHDGDEGPICEWCSSRCDIGRDPSCDISISLPTVAPIHCSLELLENGLVKATSHSEDRFVLLIDGVELKGSRILPNGCLITVGDRHLRFFYPSLRKSVHFIQSPMVSSDTVTASGDSPQKSPMIAKPSADSPRTIASTGSMPKVHPSKKSTPKPKAISPARLTPRSRSATPKVTLGTRERYGPLPPRPVATPPVIQVLRHTPGALSPQPTPPQRAATSPRHVNSSPSYIGPLGETEQVTAPPIPKTPQIEALMRSPRSTSRSATASPRQKSNNLSIPDRQKTPFKSADTAPHRSPPSVFRSATTKSTQKPYGVMRRFGASNTPNRARPSQNLTPYASPIGRFSLDKSTASTKRLTPKISHSYSKELNRSVSNASPMQNKSETLKNSPSQSLHDKTIAKSPRTAQKVATVAFKRSEVNRSRSFSTSRNQGPKNVRTESVRSNVAYPQSAHVRRAGVKRNVKSRASMLSEDILRTAAFKRSKGVSFGPALSPEQFDRTMPPSTPVKKGAVPSKFSTPNTSQFISHAVTPARSKLGESRLSNVSSKFTSPSYAATTPGRISGVISIPPTPDDNLLDSQSEYNASKSDAKRSVPLKARYSAPIARSNKVKRDGNSRNVRHSLGITRSIDINTRLPQPKAPPSTPASVEKSGLLFEDNSERLQKFDSRTTSPTPHRLPSRSETPNLSRTDTSQISHHSSNKGKQSDSHIYESPKHSRSTSRSPSATSSASLQRSRSTSPAAENRRLTGVRRLLKTPKSVKSPRVSGVAGIFAGESTPVAVTSANRSRSATPGSGSVGRGSVGRSLSKTPGSARRAVAKTPRLTGVRRLSMTPKSVKSPRVSGVSGTFAGESTPVAVTSASRSRSATPGSGSVGRGSVGRSLSKTPGSARRAVAKTPRLTGVRRLLKTPKSVKSPRLSGVADLFAAGLARDSFYSNPRVKGSTRRDRLRIDSGLTGKIVSTPITVPSAVSIKSGLSSKVSRNKGGVDVSGTSISSSDVVRSTRNLKNRLLRKPAAREQTEPSIKRGRFTRTKSDDKAESAKVRSASSTSSSSQTTRGRGKRQHLPEATSLKRKSSSTERKAPAPPKLRNVRGKSDLSTASLSGGDPSRPSNNENAVTISQSSRKTRTTRSKKAISLSATNATPKSHTDIRSSLEKASPKVSNRKPVQTVKEPSTTPNPTPRKRLRSTRRVANVTPLPTAQKNMKSVKSATASKTRSKQVKTSVSNSPKAIRSTRSLRTLLDPGVEVSVVSTKPSSGRSEGQAADVSPRKVTSKVLSRKVPVKSVGEVLSTSKKRSRSIHQVSDPVPSPVRTGTRRLKASIRTKQTSVRSPAAAPSPVQKRQLADRRFVKSPESKPTAPSPRKTRAMRKRV